MKITTHSYYIDVDEVEGSYEESEHNTDSEVSVASSNLSSDEDKMKILSRNKAYCYRKN